MSGKRKRLFYGPEDDLHLLREVDGQNPFEDTSRWSKICENLAKATDKEFSIRSLRERVNLLVSKYERKANNDKYKSGVEEEVSEMDDLLNSISLLMKEFQRKEKLNQKSSYQKGFEKREVASDAATSWSGANADQIEYYYIEDVKQQINTTQESVSNPSTSTVNIVDSFDVEPRIEFVENSAVAEGSPSTPICKRGHADRGGGTQRSCRISGSARVKSGVKHSSLKFLETKNDRWFQIRSRELALEEKKMEIEAEEKKKKLEIESMRLEMEQLRFKAEMDIFDNQQKLMQIALQAICDWNKH